jgi:predicted ATPase
LVFLDDLHWADAASIGLLLHLTCHLDADAETRLLVAYRAV